MILFFFLGGGKIKERKKPQTRANHQSKDTKNNCTRISNTKEINKKHKKERKNQPKQFHSHTPLLSSPQSLNQWRLMLVLLVCSFSLVRLSLGYQNLFVTLSLSLSLSLLKAHQIHCFQRMKVMIPEWGKFLIP